MAERFGVDFFRSIPRSPGVYLMRDAAARVVYVGKARNLRQRVGSYRHASADVSRKTARLVNAVREITWELASSEEEALLRENALLRELRPKFNRVNTFPQRHAFISVERRDGVMVLRLTTELTENCFGAFKAQGRAAFRALARLIWAEVHAVGYGALPRALIVDRGPREVALPWQERVHQRLHAFLAGEESALVTCSDPESNLFFQAFRTADLETLEKFFVSGPARNRALRSHFNLGDGVIAPHELDDLLVRLSFHSKAQREGNS
jgi:hypothetical protein